MDVKKQIKSLISHADIYKSQGLLNEAKDKYINAWKIIKENEKFITNHKSLQSALSKKIKALKLEIEILENEKPDREMSEQVQKIIKEKFAFSDNKETAELEGAVALTKFGQYGKALEEFNSLLSVEKLRLEAAKNIIRCHVGLDTIKEAVAFFNKWTKSDLFSYEQLKILHTFLQSILDKKGVNIILPLLENQEQVNELSMPDEDEHEKTEISEDEILDISSVGIALDQEKTYEFDVSFQSGTIINLLISDKEKELLENLKPGDLLGHVQFYSPIAMFEGQGIVASKSKIEAGPKTGHYSVDIQIKSL
ncbi:tetratricopeptide-like domain-containing protein [Desulfonema limicola]|uniref:Tetratricopeptide-like domain-containing protein n=1 Tax=Desulfonema limicola TaxID=45656 RepID=A0A975B9A6_9BACT|nr:hypothetical protein [Desulfonema limicola]QTA81243.1 tetratricopeptide-like domain-containing protein [Desulfonema limicola]